MKLYLVRHGQTDWNLNERIQGLSDIPLNDTGITQAKELAQQIKAQGLAFDAVYASPLQRAYNTAEIITDKQYNIITSPLIVERSFGDIEGTTPSERTISNAEIDDSTVCSQYNIETIDHIFERSEQFLAQLRSTHPNDATILVVAHGGFLRHLHFTIVGHDANTDLYSARFGNCEMRVYEI